MTDPGHVGSAGVAPPPFTYWPGDSHPGVWRQRPGGAASTRRSCSGAFLAPRRALDVEAPRFRQPGDPLAEFVRGRLQRPGELDDRRQARLATRPLQKRDL